MTGKAKEYVVLENLTDRVFVLTHPEGKSADIALGVRASAVIDPDVWDQADVPHLRRLLDANSVRITKWDHRPDVSDRLGNMKWPSDKSDATIARMIVLSHDEQFVDENINMTPVQENIAGSPLDIAFLRTHHRPVLKAAREGCELLGTPDALDKIKMIDERLKWIDELPAA